jgi:hypothetical protein
MHDIRREKKIKHVLFIESLTLSFWSSIYIREDTFYREFSSTMSSDIVDSLRYATQQSIIYIGFVAVVSGVVGNILNIIIFTSLKTFRETSCAFYLTIASAVNIAQVLNGLMARIFITGYHIDLTQTSLFLCKIRSYIWTNCVLFWLTCLCFAAID